MTRASCLGELLLVAHVDQDGGILFDPDLYFKRMAIDDVGRGELLSESHERRCRNGGLENTEEIQILIAALGGGNPNDGAGTSGGNFGIDPLSMFAAGIL